MALDTEGTYPYDKFKGTKKYTAKILCSYSKINLRDSWYLNIKNNDSKMFRSNSTHEEKSAIQESILVIYWREIVDLHSLLYRPTWRRNQAKMNFKLR